jgi:hypothetical protein
MKPQANPINQYGERNVFCPHYNRCLDHAVKYAWPTWECGGCELRRMQSEPNGFDALTFNDGIPFYELSPKVAKVYYQRFC